MTIGTATLADLALALAALVGIILALKSRRDAVREKARLLAEGVNGSALVAATAGIKVETLRTYQRTALLAGGVWLVATPPLAVNLYVLVGAVIVALLIDDYKSAYLAGARRKVAALERARRGG